MRTRRIKTTVVAACAAVTIGLIGAPFAAGDEGATAAPVTTATIGQ